MAKLPKHLENKIKIQDSINFDRYILEGSLDKVIESLQDLQTNNSGWDNLSIDLSVEGDSYYGHSIDATLTRSRLETDEEYLLRIEKYKELLQKTSKNRTENKKLREQEEKELYEKLKKKFEKK